MNAYKHYFWLRVSFFLTVLSLVPVISNGQAYGTPASPAYNGTNNPNVENSRQNTIDRRNTLTADKQSNASVDVRLTRHIRQSVEGSRDLSALAKNIKIITVGGKVTLRGTVKTAEEKNRVEQLAKSAAGENNVSDQLQVKANQ